jgi:hypothetical protein
MSKSTIVGSCGELTQRDAVGKRASFRCGIGYDHVPQHHQAYAIMGSTAVHFEHERSRCRQRSFLHDLQDA